LAEGAAIIDVSFLPVLQAFPIMKTDSRFRRLIHNPGFHLALVLGVYAVLLLPTLGRQGISWDEQNDLWIAQAYLQPGGWFAGSPIDPSQARLPMFVTALVYVITGAHDLLTGRFASALVGGLALTGVYVYAQRRFSSPHALLASGLLATSPFYLSFARVAFTETDIYLACAVIWLLAALDRLQEKPRVGMAALAGVLFGLAVSTKFTALALLPVIWIALWRGKQPESDQAAPAAHAWYWAGWSLAVLLAARDFIQRIPAEDYTPGVQAVHYSLAAFGWLLPLGWALRFHRSLSSPRALAGFATGLGLLTFFILPPDHLTNPRILESLLWRAQNEMAFSLSFMGEAAALHLLSIFFKSTPVIGMLLLAGWAAAAWEWKNQAVRLPLLLSGGYFAGLLLLPIAQTFYAIPILPVLAIFAADGWIKILRRSRRWGWLLGVFAIVMWGIEMNQCYPDYNLNGYQWLGARPLFGRSSIGYRSVVQTPSDGVQQAIEYINAHAAAGDTVQVYALPWHIVLATAGEPAYRLQSGFEYSLFSKPDYVVVHINALIWHGWHEDTPVGSVIRYPYDPVQLGAEYRLVFREPRAFGLEAVSVWRRKE
jgi:4-amino-4-deoxy-L-arabinose transferase-like glycosyltransferase